MDFQNQKGCIDKEINSEVTASRAVRNMSSFSPYLQEVKKGHLLGDGDGRTSKALDGTQQGMVPKEVGATFFPITGCIRKAHKLPGLLHARSERNWYGKKAKICA